MWTKIAKTLSLAVIGLFVLTSLEAVEPDIWHLSEGGQWTKAGDLPSGEYMLAVARIKQMINAGETEEAQAALEKLKSDFADVMGDQRDLDAFTEAEILYSAGKWNKAAKKYGEFLGAWPNSWLTESALERRFSIANAYLNGQKRRVIKILKLYAYEEGYNIMYKIADRTGDEPIAKRSLITLAESLEKRKKYMESYEIWADISSRWPTGEMGKNSLLKMAQTMHSAYKSPRYDSTPLASAQTYYGNFARRYPESARENNVEENIELIDQQLAYKQLTIAQYYDRTEHPLAANLYYQYVIDNWPQSSAAEMAKQNLEIIKSGKPGKKDAKRRLFDATNKAIDKWLGFINF